MNKIIIAAVLLVGACGDPSSVNSTDDTDSASQTAVETIRDRWRECLTAAGYDLEQPRVVPTFAHGEPQRRIGTRVFLDSPAGQLNVHVYLPELVAADENRKGIYPKEAEDAVKLTQAGCPFP